MYSVYINMICIYIYIHILLYIVIIYTYKEIKYVYHKSPSTATPSLEQKARTGRRLLT